MLSVEVQHSNSVNIKKLMRENGYRVYKHIKDLDVLFVKENK